MTPRRPRRVDPGAAGSWELGALGRAFELGVVVRGCNQKDGQAGLGHSPGMGRWEARLLFASGPAVEPRGLGGLAG